jgi:hypothetical protein
VYQGTVSCDTENNMPSQLVAVTLKQNRFTRNKTDRFNWLAAEKQCNAMTILSHEKTEMVPSTHVEFPPHKLLSNIKHRYKKSWKTYILRNIVESI